MRMRAFISTLAAAFLALSVSGVAAATAAPAPAWTVTSLAAPTNFVPGDTEHDYYYEVEAVNTGGAATDGSPITITDTLPAGLGIESVELELRYAETGTKNFAADACTSETVGPSEVLTCTVTEAIPGTLEPARLVANEQIKLRIHVSVPPSASGSLVNDAEVSGGGAGSDSLQLENEASTEIAPGGYAEFGAQVLSEDGLAASAAASHPYQFVTTFAVNTKFAGDGKTVIGAGGILKNIEVKLPPGLLGDPTATPRCSRKDFTTVHLVNVGTDNVFPNDCPPSSAVGVIILRQFEGFPGDVGPIFNLEPPPGMPAQLGFAPIGAPIYIDTELRSDGDYGVTARIRNASEAKRITASTVVLWGDPADPSHDRLRGECSETGGLCDFEADPAAFLRLPTACGPGLPVSQSFDSWDAPGLYSEASMLLPAVAQCDQPPFSPTISAKPTTTVADSPSGLDVDLHIPQSSDPGTIGTADLRDAVVTLPPGLLVNPASAGGLDSCSPAQVGLTSGVGQLPATFDRQPVSCPEAAKVGTVQIETPLLDHPLPGAVYLAQQSQNPFASLLSIYVVIEDPRSGIVVKLAGKVDPDPVTGQLTTTFANNPQLPFEDFHFRFFSGSRAPLRTPPACGTYTTTTAMTPHTAPASGPAATPSDSFAIGQGPAGACPSGALAPSLTAGLANPTAGSYSPFYLRVARADATGEFFAVSATTPPGLSARLAGIPYCPESAIAQAAARSAPGQGALEASLPSCPAASAVGSVSAGAGAGPEPFFVNGQVYLAGPYKGAPLSLVATIPAVAGPFDLGVVVDRIALYVNPETAQVNAVGDPFPTIRAGIPLDVREVRLALDRPGFTIAPTNCEPSALNATVAGPTGAASVSERFQVGNCEALGFKPKLDLRFKGGTRRDANPQLRAVLSPRPGDANISRAAVVLPPSVQVDNDSIELPCTRASFDAGTCSKKAILGHAKAWTPLLAEPLEGPVYFRSNGGVRLLPDIVADLRGQLRIVLVGGVDTLTPKTNPRLRTTFAVVPDAPVTRFELTVFGGKGGWLVNNRNTCTHRYKAEVKMNAQNGRRKSWSIPAAIAGCKKKPQQSK